MIDSSDIDLVLSLREKIRKHKPCQGYGHILKDGTMRTCECKIEAQYEYRLAKSGIPRNFARKDFADFAQKDSAALARIHEYLEKAEDHRREGTGLYLHGPSYTGKSLLACSLLKALMKKGWDCKYLTFDGILDDRDSGLKSQIDSEWDFLALDNVGKVLNRLTNFRDAILNSGQTHGAVEYLEALVARRVNSCRPIIVLGTSPLQDINAKFPSLASALIGSCLSINCEDRGFRKKRLDLMMEVDPNG